MIIKFSDVDIGEYSARYPIITLSSEILDNKKLINDLKNHVRYKYSNYRDKREILSKFNSVLSVMDKVVYKFNQIYPKLSIKHISIGGSYIFKKEVSNDIDFDVIVKGSFFSYNDIFDIEEINSLIDKPVNKISFMVFGEDDFLKKNEICDTIETIDFIHTSLIMREGLVFSLRNITVFGSGFNKQIPDKKNILLRIKKQLYHAELILNSEVYKGRTKEQNLSKAAGRIIEGMFYVSQLFPEFYMNIENIIKQEKKMPDTKLVRKWLQELKFTISKIEPNSMS